MNIKNAIRSKVIYLVNRILHPHRYSSEVFIDYYRSKGTIIGKNTHFFGPVTTCIDDKRAAYVKIGDDCCITGGVQFLCHDYSWSILIKTHKEILPDPGRKIVVGNNVFIGWNSLIIGPVEIGDNVIIGANSVVTKNLQSNAVYAGVPARRICSIDEYYNKKKKEEVNNAKFRAQFIFEKTGIMPKEEQMAWFKVLWSKRTEEEFKKIKVLPYKGCTEQDIREAFFNTQPLYENYNSFLNDVFGKNEQ